MDQFGRFPVAAVAADHHQAGVGQLLGQGPLLVAELGPHGHPAAVAGAAAGLDQLDKETSSGSLLVRVQASKHSFGMAGQRPFDAADGLVGGVSQASTFLALPEGIQGELEQRQVAVSAADITQDPGDQLVFKDDALELGRPGDRGLQLVRRHGPEHVTGILEQVG